MVEAWTWALLTPGLLFLNRKLAVYDLGPRWTWRAALLLLLSIPVCMVHTYVAAVFLFPIAEATWNPLRDPTYAQYFFIGGWQTYVAIFGVLMTVELYKENVTERLELEQMERRLLQSQLNVLRMQLEPHFLFNTLNAISSEVAGNPQLARNMIEDLAALLRLAIDYRDSTEIPLSQEIVLLNRYLAIQKVRFGDRLTVDTHIDPEVKSALVPCLLLQPIVENAIRHGLGGQVRGGAITISACRDNEHVEILVRDDGVGLPAGWEAAKGLGITVTRERLTALYPGEAGQFAIRRRESVGTEVLMRLPLRTSEQIFNESAVK